MRVLRGIMRALVKLALFALFAWLFVKPFALLAASFFTSQSPGIIRETTEFMGILFRTVLLYLGLAIPLSITHKLREHRFAQIVAGFASTALLCWFIQKAIGAVVIGMAKLMSAAVAVIAAFAMLAAVVGVFCKYNPGTLFAFWLMFGDKDDED